MNFKAHIDYTQLEELTNAQKDILRDWMAFRGQQVFKYTQMNVHYLLNWLIDKLGSRSDITLTCYFDGKEDKAEVAWTYGDKSYTATDNDPVDALWKAVKFVLNSDL